MYKKMENGKCKVQSAKRRKMDKKGVSPVIGVILMVAATIVIAAVVIAMLGGFSAPKSQYLVTATAAERMVNASGTQTPTIFVTYQGGPDASQVSCVTGDINGVDDQTWVGNKPAQDATGWGNCGDTAINPKVGTGGYETTAVNSGPNNDHVTVTATFFDGTAQVILDTYV